MPNDGWIRRDPKSGEWQKKSWLDELLTCGVLLFVVIGSAVVVSIIATVRAVTS